MLWNDTHKRVLLNVLISLVVTLTVNFSYFASLSLNVDPGWRGHGPNRPPHERIDDNRRPRPDGMPEPDGRPRPDRRPGPRHGFSPQDQRMDMPEGIRPHGQSFPQGEQRMSADSTGAETSFLPEETISALDSLEEEVYIREQNLRQRYQRFDPMKYYQKQYKRLTVYDLLFYLAVTFLLLSITTRRSVQNNGRKYLLTAAVCLFLTVVVYFLAPQMTWMGHIIFTFQAIYRFNPMSITKLMLVFVIAVMYGKIYQMLMHSQQVELENERLKSENILSQYTMLVSQINPHFLFNSLNSLTMLVRENKTSDAVTYINELSSTFRYIIQQGKTNVTTLEEELKFLDSYRYIFEVRYEGKFFVDIDVPDAMKSRYMPSLSLQPLIENAVKHNVITAHSPLRVSITCEDEYLIVSNRKAPKIDDSETGTGTGLKNLQSRYSLLTGCDVIIENSDEYFTVRLPLSTKPL